MFASLRYINTHHAASPIPGQQFDRHFPTSTSTLSNPTTTSQPTTPNPYASEPLTNNNADPATSSTDDPSHPPRPDSPQTFAAALRELSRDLVMKEQQIEALIQSLPGVGRGREEQEGRLRGLERELRVVEEEGRVWERVREELVERVERVIGRVERP